MISRTYGEFEAYAEAIQDVDMRWLQCRPDIPRWSICRLQPGPLHLQRCFDGSGNIAEGAVRQDGWVFLLTMAGQWDLANGQDFDSESVFVSPPGAEFCVASHRARDWVTVFVPTNVLFPVPDEIPSGLLVADRVVRPPQSQLRQLRKTIVSYMAAAEANPSIVVKPKVASQFTEDICCLFQEMLETTEAGRSFARRFMRLRRLTSLTTELLKGAPNMSPKIAELAQDLDVSERTLRSAFADYCGMSPHKYIALARLNKARRLLCESDPTKITIQSLAAEVGFWDCGRFAAKYRQVFGELPCETLRRKRTGE